MKLKEHPILVVFIVCTLIVLLGEGIALFLGTDVTGEVLSEDFLEILRLQKFADALSVTCAFSCVFYLLAIANYLYGYYHVFDKSHKNKMLITALLGTAFLGVALINAVPIAMNKAEVCVGTVCDMDSKYRSGGKGRTGWRSYYLIFEEGGKKSVSNDVYYSTEIGDSYYTVYCGRKLIEIYDMESYRLPADFD